MDEEVRPAALPRQILRRAEAITLYQVAVGALALLSVIGVLGVLVLAWAGREAPGGIWTILGLCVGGLVGLLAGEQAKTGDA